MPKTHRDFWEEKFRKNVERDGRKIDALQAEGWAVKVIWECQVKKQLEEKVEEVRTLYQTLGEARK